MIRDLVIFTVGVILGMLGVHFLNQKKIQKLRRDLERTRRQLLKLIGGL